MSAAQVIAIDGPAASGKSSVARLLARRLGWLFVNSGNMYRAVTWAVVEKGIDPADAESVAGLARSLRIEFPVSDGQSGIAVDGRQLCSELTADSVNRAVSLVARVPAVRELLVAAQRELAESGPLVMEGRDIGSVVFPHAANKFYIDASEAVRAKRRQAQGHTDSVADRDRLDSTRKNSPLMVAKDAVVIDSSDLTLDEVVAEALAILKTRGILPRD